MLRPLLVALFLDIAVLAFGAALLAVLTGSWDPLTVLRPLLVALFLDIAVLAVLIGPADPVLGTGLCSPPDVVSPVSVLESGFLPVSVLLARRAIE